MGRLGYTRQFMYATGIAELFALAPSGGPDSKSSAPRASVSSTGERLQPWAVPAKGAPYRLSRSATLLLVLAPAYRSAAA